MHSHTKQGAGLIHAGAGTGIFLIQLSALFPGLLPTVALLGVVAVVLVLPMIVLALAGAVVAAPLYVAWRLIARLRHGGRPQEPDTSSAPLPALATVEVPSP